MPYITPQGKPLAYTPQRKARFPFPPQGIPVVAPPAPPVAAWSMFMHDHYHRSVADTSANVIYFGNYGEKLFSLNPDGTLRWVVTFGKYTVTATPIVNTEGIIYIGGCRDYYLYAFNPDGTIKWRCYLEGSIPREVAVDLETGIIYVNSYASYVAAVNSDGVVEWKCSLYEVPEGGVTLYKGEIYVCDWDSRIYRISSEGEIICFLLADDYALAPTPALDDYGNIYIGFGDFKIYAFNNDCTLKWFYATGDEIEESSASIDAQGNIYIGSRDSRIYALNPDGTLRWSFQTGDSIRSSPALSQAIYIGSDDGCVYALNFDGTLKWRFSITRDIVAPPSVDKDEIIFIGSYNSYMYSLNPDGTCRWSFYSDGQYIVAGAAIV